ncbi:MAG TPA: PEGA domain-containing protein [Treponemataceae bacterium]|nr:PEGA domain-containing protein [Treponemataceae bacterium]
MKNPARAVVAALAIVLLGAQASAEPKDSVMVTQTERDEAPSLTVETDIQKAEIYLDGIYRGLTPLVIGGVAPGIRRLELRKEGYYLKSWSIKIEKGQDTKVYAELVRITGYLSVTGLPQNGFLEIDGETHRENRIELATGLTTVRIRAFGYVERSETVLIRAREETRLDAALEQAAFAVSDLRPTRQRFNPANPAGLGATEIRFEATAPGMATVAIVDSEGQTVAKIDAGPFDTWEQAVRWDGRRADGQIAPDGKYSIRLVARAEGNGDTAPIALDSAVIVDGSIFYPLTGSRYGLSAIGPVISATPMPAGGVRAIADIRFEANALSYGISITGGFTDALEAGAEIGLARSPSGVTIPFLSAGCKAALRMNRTSLALTARYSASIEPTSAASEGQRGLGIGVAAEWLSGPFALGAGAEFRYGDGQGLFVAPYASAQAGVSARATLGVACLGLYAAMDARNLAGGIPDGPTASVGAAFQALIPGTSILASARGGFEHGTPYGFRPSVGGGFGVLF